MNQRARGRQPAGARAPPLQLLGANYCS
jgi:hypothetical protein